MSAADDDLIIEVVDAMAGVIEVESSFGASQVLVVLAQAAIAAVRKHDAGKILMLRPRELSTGSDGTRKPEPILREQR